MNKETLMRLTNEISVLLEQDIASEADFAEVGLTRAEFRNIVQKHILPDEGRLEMVMGRFELQRKFDRTNEKKLYLALQSEAIALLALGIIDGGE